jgi:hypothetical protein
MQLAMRRICCFLENYSCFRLAIDMTEVRLNGKTLPAKLIIDATGVGSAVSDFFSEAWQPHEPVMIAAVSKVTMLHTGTAPVRS